MPDSQPVRVSRPLPGPRTSLSASGVPDDRGGRGGHCSIFQAQWDLQGHWDRRLPESAGVPLPDARPLALELFVESKAFLQCFHPPRLCPPQPFRI